MLTPSDGPRPGLVSRRVFCRSGGGLAIASLALPGSRGADSGPTAGRETTPGVAPSAARSCILVYLLGGPSHLDMWDLKPDAPAEVRGPFRPIATSLPGLHICEHLPRLATLAQKYAVVRSVSHHNHNHTPMIYYTLTGRPVDQPDRDNDVRPPQRTDFPHHGAVLAWLRPVPTGVPGHVAIPELAVRSSIRGEFKRTRERLRGGGGGVLGPLCDPLGIDGEPGAVDAIPALSLPRDVTQERLEQRHRLLSVLEHSGPGPLPASRAHGALHHQAVLLSGSARRGHGQLFTLDSEPDLLRRRYGEHRFGKAMLLARRLAEAGVPMVAIHFNEMTVCDGWDTHSKNFEALQDELLPMLDQGLTALIEDLDQRGLLEQTLIVVMGEFGRTPRINAQAGRDHWGSCSSAVLAGGGIHGGMVHGSSDRLGAYPTSEPVDPVDLQATLFHCMGLDPKHVLRDPLGRPFPISTGEVISSLVSSPSRIPFTA
jgi:hypothetical protein